MLQTPVLFIIFNRPDTTKRVFDELRKAKPGKLYIAADGPREDKDGEEEKVMEVRSIATKVDWVCEVKTLFREKNLGCKNAVSSAISWFFENEPMGIILEDDCLPDPSFFGFCEEMLVKYKDDETIAGITGAFHMLKNTTPKPAGAYGRISFPIIWGWASWQRVWKEYDTELKEVSKSSIKLGSLSKKRAETQRYFLHHFNKVSKGELDTWDYQFAYLALKKSMSFIHPYRNLISNIGFGVMATHTRSNADYFSLLPTHPVEPPFIEIASSEYDGWLERNLFSMPGLGKRIVYKIIRILRGSL